MIGAGDSRRGGVVVFDPLDHPGLPIEQHGRHWRELDVEPIDVRATDSDTRGRISAMRAIEAAATLFDRELTRRCPDDDARRAVSGQGDCAFGRRRHVAALQPSGNALQNAVGSERAAFDLVIWAARNELEPGRVLAFRRQAGRHLTRLRAYAELADRSGVEGADRIVGEVGDLLSASSAGPPMRRRRSSQPVARAPRPISLLDDWAVHAAHQQIAANPGRDARPAPATPTAAGLQRGGWPADTGLDGWERLVVHESATCYVYYSFLTQESDPRLRAMWELHLQMGLAHLRTAGDLLRQHTGRDPQEVVGEGLPEPAAWASSAGPIWVTEREPERAAGRNGPETAAEATSGESAQQPSEADQDLVDLMIEQHVEIENSFERQPRVDGEARHMAFAELARLIAVHEIVEESVVHPLARRLEPDEHVADRLVDEERRIGEALADALRTIGADHDPAETTVVLRDIVLAHARHEERHEFPLLREAVPEAELRQMARALRTAVTAGAEEQADDAGPRVLRQTEERVRDTLAPLTHAL
jgi:hypothetical protein